MSAPLVAGVLLLVSLAGCLVPAGRGPPELGVADPFAGLGAEGARVTRHGDVLTFAWDGTVPLVARPGAGDPVRSFALGPGVGAVAVRASGEVPLHLTLADAEGAVLCRASGPAAACVTPTPPGMATRQQWSVQLKQENSTNPAIPETPYHLEVALRAGAGAALGDLETGLSPSLRFVARGTGHPGLEPTLGVARSGAIFEVALARTLRSRDGGMSWEDVTPPASQPTTFDPYLYVDPLTNRVFVSQLSLACITLSWSDDEGDTWVTHPAACGAPVDDHQKITVGDNPLPVKPYDGAIYISEHAAWYALAGVPTKVLFVQRSFDGGLTWQGGPALTFAEADFRTTGPIAADRAGNVYVPVYLLERGLEGSVGVLVSHDHGQSWKLVRAAPNATAARGIDPDLAIDRDGNVFVVYAGDDGRAWIAASRDRGETWAGRAAASPPGVSVVFPVVVAGDAGSAAVAFLGTPDSAADPSEVPPWTRWHLYVGSTADSLGASPFAFARATAPNDPAQIGTLCARGVNCPEGNARRNHADFIDIAATPDGRVAVSFTDGCPATCATSAASTHSEAAFAIQLDGPRLFR